MPDGGAVPKKHSNDLPAGLTVQEAGVRLLMLGGISSPSWQAPTEAESADAQLQALSASLSATGLAVEASTVLPRHVTTLRAPALLRLRNGQWLLLRRVGRHRLLVEGHDGLARVRTAALVRQTDGQALVLLPRLPTQKTVAGRFAALFWEQRGAFLLVALTVVPLQLLTVGVAELSSRALGQALPDGATSLLMVLVASVMAATLLLAAMAWFRDRMVLSIATWIELAAKQGYLSHALGLPYAVLQQYSLGQLLQGVSGITAARTLLLERVVGAVLDGAALIAYVAAMAYKLWAPTLTVVIASFLLAVVVAASGMVQARIQADEVKAQARQRGYLTELVAGMRTLKASGLETRCEQRWAGHFEVELGHALRRQRVGLPVQICMEVARNGFLTTMLIWGGYGVLNGQVDLGQLLAFLLLGQAFVRAVIGLLDAVLSGLLLWPQLRPAIDVLALEAPLGRKVQLTEAVTVRAKDVWFRHAPDQEWIVRGENLTLVPGQQHWLSGASGSGKTTLLRLLAGLYVPERGVISFGGVAAGSTPGHVLYLPQVVQLFSGSIIDNMRIFSNNASPDRLLATAGQTGFEKTVLAMPLKYDTPLPRGGATLSGGQRQMLALTAALASECNVLLLDEPMANLDTQSAMHVRQLLDGCGKTIVIAEHR